VVLPDGRVVRTGGAVVKSSAGYDLTALFTGAEGTLGVVTEVLVGLVPVPEVSVACVASFAELGDAVQTVVDLKRAGVRVSRAELLDAETMRAVRLAGLEGHPDAPTLFLEFSGPRAATAEAVEAARAVSAEHAATRLETASHADERARLWRARHAAYYSCLRLRGPGTKGWPTDVCVPLSALTSSILDTARDVRERGLVAPIFGHAGDGNYHVIFLYREDEDGERGLRTIMDLNDRIVRRALACGGTCTGEHGVGYGKRGFMLEQHGVAGVQLMRDVKRAVDPWGIMNPGKVLP